MVQAQLILHNKEMNYKHIIAWENVIDKLLTCQCLDSFCVKNRKTAGSPSSEKCDRGIGLPRPENRHSKVDDVGGRPVRDVVKRLMICCPPFPGVYPVLLSLLPGRLSFEQVLLDVVTEEVEIPRVDQDSTQASCNRGASFWCVGSRNEWNLALGSAFVGYRDWTQLN
jgi:hypothetical protein